MLVIANATTKTQNEILAKSVVGSLPKEIPDVTLSEIRWWVGSTWRHDHGINIYDLGRNQFLFEFPNRTVADHIVRRQCFWKSHKLNLQWWSPTSNAIHKKWVYPCNFGPRKSSVRLETSVEVGFVPSRDRTSKPSQMGKVDGERRRQFYPKFSYAGT